MILADPSRPARLPTPRVRAPMAPGLLVVGASTGGPQALMSLIGGLARHVARLPVCVTLHMPRDLMPVIAAHVARRCAVETFVVDRPCPLAPGIVYFAPGDRHLGFRRLTAGYELTPLANASTDFCKPAVDVMFGGAAKMFGARTLAIVLSGMGKDGLAGATAIVAARGVVLVQDQASSAVWGMPGAVAKAGLAAAALPPQDLAVEVVRRLETLAVTR